MEEIKLTPEEKNLVVAALQSVYLKHLKIVEENRDLLDQKSVDAILANGYNYDDLLKKLKSKTVVV